jgi:hypothetical protein
MMSLRRWLEPKEMTGRILTRQNSREFHNEEMHGWKHSFVFQTLGVEKLFQGSHWK